MVLYTIGFTQKSAQQFFELIKSNNIDILVDIRLNNKSQLAGFTKGDDLRYFWKKSAIANTSTALNMRLLKIFSIAIRRKLLVGMNM